MKERIISQSLEMFRCYGIKSVTMDDISQKLGISKRTLYEHFENKETLLTECVKKRLERQGFFDDVDSGVLDLLIRYHSDNEKLYRSVNCRCFSDIRKYHNSVYVYLKEIMADFAKMCSNRIPEGIKNGYIRPDTSPYLVYTILLKHLSGIFSNDRFFTDISHEHSASDVVLIFARGIATSKGHKYIDNQLSKKHENN